jgi:predicted PhzF superfamily epimerase YddE/YHI9
MEEQTIEAGTQILIGAPAEPMPRAQSAAVADMLAGLGFEEAHLPQIYMPGAMERAAEVLVVVVRPGADVDALMHEVGCRLAQMLPEGERLDVWPLTEQSGALPDVRAAGCRILGTSRARKPWWRFW